MAANDTRGRQTWRGCDETGLMGLACRHDHLLKFINIVQTGERLVANGTDYTALVLVISIVDVSTGAITLWLCLTGFYNAPLNRTRKPQSLEYYTILVAIWKRVS